MQFRHILIALIVPLTEVNLLLPRVSNFDIVSTKP